MASVQLTPASLALLLHDLGCASDNDQRVELELGDDGIKVKIGDGPWGPPLDTPGEQRGSSGQGEQHASAGHAVDPGAQPARPHLYPYIDLSGCVIPQDEFDDIEAAPATLTPHDDGAWIHVPYDDDDRLDDEHAVRWEHFPHLRQVLIAARQLGARWINLDRDGVDTFENLPTFGH